MAAKGKEVSRAQLRSLVRKWQRILRLQDWRVTVDYDGDMWDDWGEVTWDIEAKTAHIRINPVSPPEETIIHELLHLHAAPLGDLKGYKSDTLEQMIELTAGALYELSNGG